MFKGVQQKVVWPKISSNAFFMTFQEDTNRNFDSVIISDASGTNSISPRLVSRFCMCSEALCILCCWD